MSAAKFIGGSRFGGGSRLLLHQPGFQQFGERGRILAQLLGQANDDFEATIALEEVTGDLAAKRAHVTGTQSRAASTVAISGLVPVAELGDYQGRLKSLTAGQGSYSLAFSHYAEVPEST